MKIHRKRSGRFLIGLALSVTLAAGSALAQPRGSERHGNGRAHDRDYPLNRGHPYPTGPDHIRHYHDVIILRPYGHRYPGYGHYHSDESAYPWLAFTAITLAILNNMNEAQQRAYEQAQIDATTAPIGEKIIWNDGNASGSVTAIRDGVSTAGRYCREFQQVVTIAGKKQQAYGTACQRPDGSWEVVSTGDAP